MQIQEGFTDHWLQPTGAEENLMRQYAGCKRFVWNRALSSPAEPRANEFQQGGMILRPFRGRRSARNYPHENVTRLEGD